MHLGRAALALAASSALFACSQISGLSGLGFDGSGGNAGSGFGGATSAGGGVSSARGGAGGTGGGGAQGHGGSPQSTVASSAASTVSSTNAVSSTAVSSAVSSSGTGNTDCHGGDPGVCCPYVKCTDHCCTKNQGITCQTVSCDADAILCDSSSDCNGGQICCGYYNGNWYPDGIRCAATCQKPVASGAPGDYEICSLANPACRTGGTCQPAMAIPGDYGFCW